MSFKNNLEKYARAIIKVGANVQEGQVVVIRALTETREFVYTLSEQAYKEGASLVDVIWGDDELNKQKIMYASVDTLKDVRKWMPDQYNDYVDRGAVFISVIGGNPDNLDGLDVNKIREATIARSNSLKYFYKSIMSDFNSWCVVGAATPAWAKKIFPELEEKEAVEKLWNLIFKVSRATGEDSVKDWNIHLQNLADKAKYLNDMNFKYLKYRTDKGTDLTIELPKGHIWKAGAGKNSKGISFTANMPTEEVFTMPHREGVNGVVYSTKALNYNGSLIDEFKLEFKDGKVISCEAKKNEEVLKSLLITDENSSRLGEVALVPHYSPISDTNVMFYETLYDENASCHLALGEAYPVTIENGENMTEEELKNAGANISIVHSDFMIGDASLDITGITQDGKEVAIFTKGNWAK